MSFLGMDDEAVKLEMEAILATPEVTVLGIGNIILCDEGFGVRAAETLDAKYEFPDNVQVKLFHQWLLCGFHLGLVGFIHYAITFCFVLHN